MCTGKPPETNDGRMMRWRPIRDKHEAKTVALLCMVYSFGEEALPFLYHHSFICRYPVPSAFSLEMA